MLNMDAAKKARNRLKQAVEHYCAQYNEVAGLASELHKLRKASSKKLIGPIESFVNSLAATPKKYSRAFAEFRVELQTFDDVLSATDERLKEIKVNGTAGTGAGVAAGAATAAMAPTFAMAIATTFGTASTGTAIASLSGIAATNAALAWLGGGALAVGGGGMAAGSGLLALAGPVGWAIAGAAVVGGAAYVARSNRKVVEEANAKLKPVEAGIAALQRAALEIIGLRDRTNEQLAGMTALFQKLRRQAPESYADFTPAQKKMLTALINHVQSLTVLLNETILCRDKKGA